MFLQSVLIHLLGYNLSLSRQQQYDTYIIPQFFKQLKKHEISQGTRNLDGKLNLQSPGDTSLHDINYHPYLEVWRTGTG